ncbi:hypothetical protein J6590_020507 [Homalodisca vitripennis]|nr:hypothetical protein J6590_020507 [Homalodisca vitripennis]
MRSRQAMQCQNHQTVPYLTMVVSAARDDVINDRETTSLTTLTKGSTKSQNGSETLHSECAADKQTRDAVPESPDCAISDDGCFGSERRRH